MRKSEDEAKGEGMGAFRNGTTATSALFASRMMLRDPQHNRLSIARYLPVVYYYLVGTTFGIGTRWKGKPQAGESYQ
jgi:hypothetical protein